MKKFIGTLTALCLVLTPCAGAAALSTTPTQTAAVTLEQLLNVTNDQFTPLVQNGTVYLPVQIIGEFLSKVFSWGFSGGTGATATTPVTSGQTSSGSAITLDEAKAIALKDAGFSESQVTIVRAHQDYDDGRLEYEVEFYKDNVEYDYDIDAATGRIISRDYDAEYYTPITNPGSSSSGNAITLDEAKAIALKDAGFSESQVTIVRARQDYDDGRLEYEVEFYKDNVEYDYEISSTGTILSRDYDAEGYAPQTSTSGNAITLDEAKAIALKDAGFSESQVTIVRARQDYDDGRLEYEVEFYKDNVEYDYEISSTGTILSRDYDAEGYTPAQTGNAMSMDKAKQLVLDRVPGATTSNIVQFKLDYDDGRQLYEGKLFYNGLEYEFEMDAVTGTFYDWEIDR